MSFMKKLFGGETDNVGGAKLKVNMYDKIRLKNGETGYIYHIDEPNIKQRGGYWVTIYDEINPIRAEDRFVEMEEVVETFPQPEYSFEKRRAWTCAAILMALQVGVYSTRAFGNQVDAWGFTVAHSKSLLHDSWGIFNHEDAIRILDQLSKGQTHTPVANEIYSELIAKGRMEPLDTEPVDFYKFNDSMVQEVYELKETYTASLGRAKSYFGEVFVSSGKANILKQKGVLFFDRSATGQERKELPDWSNVELDEEAKKDLYNIIHDEYVVRINFALKNYPNAIKWLSYTGYTEDELKKISNFAAWDYGRCGFIAQHAHKSGYITEDEAWHYMLIAGENTALNYTSWREFLAAYFIGRFLAYGSEGINEFRFHTNYLLTHPNSVYQEFPLRR